MRNEKTTGVLDAVTAYILWGILPLYWKSISSISSIEILYKSTFTNEFS